MITTVLNSTTDIAVSAVAVLGVVESTSSSSSRIY